MESRWKLDLVDMKHRKKLTDAEVSRILNDSKNSTALSVLLPVHFGNLFQYMTIQIEKNFYLKA